MTGRARWKMWKKERPKFMPLRARVCLRQRDALMRRRYPDKAPMCRAQITAMAWEHRAMDVVYRGGDEPDIYCFEFDATDIDADIPF